MAYLDKEKAQIFLRTECLAKYPASFANGLLAAADQLNKLPTAEVAPKSEVERWRRNLEAVLEERAETRTEVAREIFAEIETALKLCKKYDLRSGTYFECYLEADISELKKKYTDQP